MINENFMEKIYNLKAVVQETGINPETLRAWERRYGLPQPDRSEGGHRRYSLYDIELLKWLSERLDEGMSISSAVDLHQSLSTDGKDPITFSPLNTPFTRGTHESMATGTGAQPLSQLRADWVTACMAFNEPRAEQALSTAFALYSPEDVCFDVLRAGLEEIGEHWYQGDITVQQEHFATAQAMRKLESLIAAAPKAIRKERILIASPVGEMHEFALLILAFLLKRRGFEVIYLGTNVPNDRLAETIREIKPDLIVSSAQQMYTAASLRDLALFARGEGVVTSFGGGIFNRLPQLVERIPGFYLGDSMENAPQRVEDYFRNKLEVQEESPLDNKNLRALEHFSEFLPLIEALVVQKMIRAEMPSLHLHEANNQIGRDIIAALKLGDLSLLGSELKWVEGLLVNFGLNPNTLEDYLETYLAFAKEALDERAAPIIEWLEKQTIK